MVEKTKVAIIGYGHLGRWHLDKSLSLDDVEVVGVVDPAPDTAQKISERGHDVAVYQDLADVIDRIDAGIIVAPTSYHFALAKKLIENDKHVFCEKPMTSTYEEACKIQDLLKGRQCIFQVGHSERFHQVWNELDGYRSYFSGPLHLFLERQAAFKGRALDVDVVQDLMIHDLDLAFFVLREMPISIRAEGHKIRTKHWDYAKAELKYASGKSVQIISGRNHTQEVRSLNVIGPQGGMTIDLLNQQFLIASAESSTNYVQASSYAKRDHLLEEQVCFFHSIREGAEVVVNIDDGMRAVFLVSKVLESLDTGKEVKL